ncbi:NADH dehydrogenase [ubiquinone] 1 beta subcomplex subunit 10-like [Tubulanus polymorphus]|uniref:NADH dehydrogenase [ubiquinone] 1 beta subcomplex subunit 10-like n=1 Tax=Tubulanus polymorphus TaxID=672921 RepID=UPI003DA27EB3
MGADGPEQKRTLEKFFDVVWGVIDAPVTFVREKIVVPMQSKNPYPYYHEKFPRVKDIDECEVGDIVCFTEANLQYKRDKLVDMKIVDILRQRKVECYTWEGDIDRKNRCKKIIEDYEQAATNYFIKYGDMGANASVTQSYMKEKHRLVWERRHGRVGMGRNAKDQPEPPIDWSAKHDYEFQ